ncbi:uncharacterized protein LOC128994857 [Macrosteles quadrilineatus]|uniref:uncharacterized protein LOC128994857 n=1 Tax=Macrosteles quadrilineatus TaxID=74068 RepID=UPI0023E14F41|nr:uncharacterized protein LOC128994857 [Macrosteles quadrilineatus]
MGSRVYDIKKKFEGLTDASKEQKIATSVVRSNQENDSNWIAKQTFENTNNRSSTRGLIKRSHAFRSDKINRNLNCNDSLDCPDKCLSQLGPSTNYGRSTSNTFISIKADESSKIDFNSSKPTAKFTPKAFKLDVDSTDPSMKQGSPQTKTNCSAHNIVNINSHTKDDILNERNDSKSIIKNTQPGKKHITDVSNITVSNLDESGKVDDKLSSTLKKVLKTPLPPGPPPKKPPRTFAHFTERSCDINSGTSSIRLSTDDINLDLGKIDSSCTLKPIRSKTESQIMLKKLEMALHNHKTQGKILEPKSEKKQLSLSKESMNSNSKTSLNLKTTAHSHSPAVRKTSLPDSPHDKTSSNDGCFGVLSCSNSMDFLKTSHIYDTPLERKSKFYLEDLARNKVAPALTSIENGFQNSSSLYGQIKLSDTAEPVYAKPLLKNRVRNLKCDKGPSVLQIVKSLNSNEKLDLKKVRGTNFDSKKTQPLHYMSSPVWEKVPLLQSPTQTPSPEKSLVAQKRLFEKSGAKSFPSRSLSLDIDNTHTRNSSARSYSLDFSHGDLNIENQKIQKMVNEVYSKCLAMPQDSDSESVASTPDDSCPPKISSPEEAQKHRQQRTAERKTYLKRVCSRARSFHRPSIVPESHLFEYLLLVGLNLNSSRCKVPYIKARYPADVEVPGGIEYLCFPDAEDWPPQAGVEDDSSRCYCVVITHSSGTRKYGYCRRVQPEGAPICLPLAYCIVSPYKANYYFSQVLKELESRHGQPEQELSSFIHELYECPFPAPGQGLRVTQPITRDKVEILPRKLDPRQEETDIARLLNLVRHSVFIQLFSTLLLERKVILLSYSISKLSTCFEGLCAALYPFHWQHTLVPIVPGNMLDVCQAPTPYVVGLLKQRDVNAPHPVVFSMIDQVLVVDVDESKVLQSCGDESTVLPPKLSRGLREALLCAVPDKNSPLSPAHNLVASEALIALFVQLIGHYRDHIITSSGTGHREFQREAFVKSVSSSTVQSFLDWFTETTMFTAFIESRLDRSVEPYGLFEQRCVEHLTQQQAMSSKGYRANINKTVKSFGDRFKEWTNSS